MRLALRLPVAPSRPGRRAMLGGVLGAATLAVTGCGVRLEDDAPPIPLIPTRERIPAETALLWLLEDCRGLAVEEGPQTGLYAEQVAVLRSALFRAGIPIDTLDELLAATDSGATPRPSPTTTPPAASGTTAATTATATASATTPEQTSGPEAALERIEDLRKCGPGIFPLVMSLLAQRWAAVTLSGGEVPASAQVPDPGQLWRFPHLAAGFVELTHAAVYGFEIVAAQAAEDSRPAAVATLGALRGLRDEQMVRTGGTASGPALGYPLPFPVRSEESALSLATHVLTGLTDGYGGLLTTVTGSAQEDTGRDVVGWLGTAASIAVEWGAALRAFPGTQDSP